MYRKDFVYPMQNFFPIIQTLTAMLQYIHVYINDIIQTCAAMLQYINVYIMYAILLNHKYQQ